MLKIASLARSEVGRIDLSLAEGVQSFLPLKLPLIILKIYLCANAGMGYEY